jgi:hypothetical protein
MVDLMEVYRYGGPVVYVLLAGGLAAMAWAVLLPVVSLARLRVPSVLWVLPTSLLLTVGLFGSWIGRKQTLAAVEMASAETKQTLVAQGISISMYSELTAAMMVMPALFLGAGLMAIANPISSWKAGAWQPFRAVVPAIWCLPVVVAAPFAAEYLGSVAYLFSAYALFAGFVCSLAATRGSDEATQCARLAAGQAKVGLLVVLIGICLAGFGGTTGEVLAFSAVTKASAETRAQLLQYGLSIARTGQALGLGFTAWLAVGALVSFVPASRTFWNARSAIGILATASALSLPIGLAGWQEVSNRSVWAQFLISPDKAFADDIASQGVTLPKASNGQPYRLAVSIVMHDTGVDVDREHVYQTTASQPAATDLVDGVIMDVFRPLRERAHNARELGLRTGSQDFAFKGRYTLSADANRSWESVDATLRTAAAAGFRNIEFAAMGDDGVTLLAVPLAPDVHVAAPAIPPDPKPIEGGVEERFVELLLSKEPERKDPPNLGAHTLIRIDGNGTTAHAISAEGESLATPGINHLRNKPTASPLIVEVGNGATYGEVVKALDALQASHPALRLRPVG